MMWIRVELDCVVDDVVMRFLEIDVDRRFRNSGKNTQVASCGHISYLAIFFPTTYSPLLSSSRINKPLFIQMSEYYPHKSSSTFICHIESFTSSSSLMVDIHPLKLIGLSILRDLAHGMDSLEKEDDIPRTLKYSRWSVYAAAAG